MVLFIMGWNKNTNIKCIFQILLVLYTKVTDSSPSSRTVIDLQNRRSNVKTKDGKKGF